MFISIPRGRYDDLDARVELQTELTAPLNDGQVIGRLQIFLDDELVEGSDIVTLGSIAPAGFFSRAWDGMRLWMDGLFGDD